MKEFELFESEAVKKWVDPKAKKSPEEIKKDAVKAIFTDFDKDYTAQKAAQDEIPPKKPLAGPDGGPGEVTRQGGQGFSTRLHPTALQRFQPKLVHAFPRSPLKDYKANLDDIDDDPTDLIKELFSEQEGLINRKREEVFKTGLIGRPPEDTESDEYLDWEEKLDDIFYNDEVLDIIQNGVGGFVSGINSNLVFPERFGGKGITGRNMIDRLWMWYTGPGFFDLNRALRHGEGGPGMLGLAKMLAQSTNANPGTVLRSLRGQPFDDLEEGDLIRDPGFMSTTFDSDVLEKFGSYDGTVMEIMNNGTLGFQIDDDKHNFFTGSEDESELVFPPNRVMRYLGDGDGTKRFEMMDVDDDDLMSKAIRRRDEDGEPFFDVTDLDYELFEGTMPDKIRAHRFFNRMNDFQFQVRKKGKKKFEEFYLHDK